MPRSLPMVLVLGLLVGVCACDRQPKPTATTAPATAPTASTIPSTSDFTFVNRGTNTLPLPPMTPPTFDHLSHAPPAPPKRERWPGDPRTDPPIFGGWLVWLQAEVEAERLINANPTGYPDPPYRDFDWIRALANENSAAATVLATLMRDYPSSFGRGYLLSVIADPPATRLRTPEVRQIVWEAGHLTFAYFDINRALAAFGPDQLTNLDEDEFLRQLESATNPVGNFVGDDVLELYLREAIRRKSASVVAILQDNAPRNQAVRSYMIRTARNRCLNQADPLAFKVSQSADDPKLVLMELALTDPDLEEYDLSRWRQPCYIDVLLQATPNGSFRPWMEKWPSAQTLRRGQPYRTAVSVNWPREKIRANKVRVWLRLFEPEVGTPADSPLLPGPRLMPPMYVDVDVSDGK